MIALCLSSIAAYAGSSSPEGSDVKKYDLGFYSTALGGLSLSTGNNSSSFGTRVIYGGSLGVTLSKTIGFGGYVFNASKSNKETYYNTTTTYKYDTLFYGGEINYFYSSNLNAGVRVGFTNISGNVDTGTTFAKTSYSQFTVGARVGYDFFLTNALALATEMDYFYLPAATASMDLTGINTTSSMTARVSSLSFINLLLGLRLSI